MPGNLIDMSPIIGCDITLALVLAVNKLPPGDILTTSLTIFVINAGLSDEHLKHQVTMSWKTDDRTEIRVVA